MLSYHIFLPSVISATFISTVIRSLGYHITDLKLKELVIGYTDEDLFFNSMFSRSLPSAEPVP